MDYDAWKSGWDDISTPIECKQCCDYELVLDHARDHLEQILNQLYSTNGLDKAKLENSLDELCWLLKTPIKEGFLQVERKNNKSVSFNFLMKLNNDLLKEIAQ